MLLGCNLYHIRFSCGGFWRSFDFLSFTANIVWLFIEDFNRSPLSTNKLYVWYQQILILLKGKESKSTRVNPERGNLENSHQYQFHYQKDIDYWNINLDLITLVYLLYICWPALTLSNQSPSSQHYIRYLHTLEQLTFDWKYVSCLVLSIYLQGDPKKCNIRIFGSNLF